MKVIEMRGLRFSRRLQECLCCLCVVEQCVVRGQWHVGSCNHASGKPPAVQGVDSEHRGGDRWAFDVYLAVRRRDIDVDVKNSAMLIAFVDDVVLDLFVPVGAGFSDRVEHVDEQEALRGDLRHFFDDWLWRLRD